MIIVFINLYLHIYLSIQLNTLTKMARFSRIKACQVMADTGMVPVFYHSDLEVSKQVLKACYLGGVRAF